MLHISDVNTNADCLDEIEQLKLEFKKILEPTVRNGSVIILSNLPAIYNLSGRIDFLIFFLIENSSHNYLRVSYEGRYCYISNFILAIKKIYEPEIDKINDEYLYLKDSELNYAEVNRSINFHFDDYLRKEFEEKFGRIRSFSLLQIETDSKITYIGNDAVVNHPLTPDLILQKVVTQSQKRFGDQKVSSFSFKQVKTLTNDFLNSFVTDIIEDCNNKSAFGILTKKKIDLITTSNKKIDEIYGNVGQSLSLISGKAGTGKTLTLIRVIHKQANNHHNLRFLTYNNLLVFDIKQNLRQFGYYGDNRIAISTLHSFFFKLSKNLGIPLLLSQSRINELLNICKIRIEKARGTFENIKRYPDKISNSKIFLQELCKTHHDRIDFDEFREFALFVGGYRNLSFFEEVKNEYLKHKKIIIEPKIGQQIFIEDYYKILELIYLAITDSKKFYDDLEIRNHYDLLSILYKTDKFVKDNPDALSDEKIISLENVVEQIKSLKHTSNWSKLLIVDECQDTHILEKEILYKLRGSENMIVATGGKDQLIRHSNELNWSVSLNKRIIHKSFPLYNGSFRQKQNIITFVNKFSDEYGLGFGLKSIAESKGLGKIIIDVTHKNHIINSDILEELLNNGKLNSCSNYESVMILIPSRNYTSKYMGDGFSVNEKDYVSKTNVSSNRQVQDKDFFNELNIPIWEGVFENKGFLKVPNQNEMRIIHYESCRGLESWSTALMSLDDYFLHKRSSIEAGNHLSDDLFLSEEERRDKYAALWCLMAFTRPIDTLYIHLEDFNSSFSKKLMAIASSCEGITIKNS